LSDTIRFPAAHGEAQDNVIASNRVNGTSVRPAWPDLPEQARASVETFAGHRVARADTQTGGFSSGLAVRLTFTDSTRLFVKGIATDHILYSRYGEEAAINQALPATVPVPRLLRSWEAGGWLLTAFQDIDGRHPDPTPGTPDTGRVLTLLQTLPATVTPSPIPAAPDFVEAVGEEFLGWQLLAGDSTELDPWSTRHLAKLAATERDWHRHSAGTTLLHADLRPDNTLLADTGDVVIDWAYLHQGAAWVDPAMFLPHLIRAGHTPAQAEAAMTAVTAWTTASPEALTSFAVALTGYWERSSRYPGPPGVPYLRPYQAEMAAIGRQWIQHRTGWS
jgi:aminoglycoside phosphotransferase (APT) family kinase protein